jgi:Protein of unknown function (DUF2690)
MHQIMRGSLTVRAFCRTGAVAVLGVALAALASVFISPVGANAAPASSAAASVGPLATCSGSGCDHKDPHATGCDANAVTVDSRNSSAGLFELRFSRTCSTNWVRVGNLRSGVSTLSFHVIDIDRNVADDFTVHNPAAGSHFGNMVYSPGSNCALGWAAADSVIVPPGSDFLESSTC